jgi:hypothetical protein
MSTATMTDVIDIEAAEAPTTKPPVVQQQSAIAQQPNAASLTTPVDLLRFAIQSGADLDRLERLMKMQMEWEANEAKKTYRRAMAAFKAECPPIFKRKQVGYTTREGDFVGYKHAELSDIEDAVGLVMARHGLTYDWDIQQELVKIIVDCIVTHVDGHSKRVRMEGPPDTSGKKNVMQQAGSAVTYLERYSLLAAIGKSTKGDDDDGGGADDQPGSQGGQAAATRGTGKDAEPRFYDQTKFDANKDSWREVVKSGRKTPAAMIKFIESKGEKLTVAQQNTIDSWAHEND